MCPAASLSDDDEGCLSFDRRSTSASEDLQLRIHLRSAAKEMAQMERLSKQRAARDPIAYRIGLMFLRASSHMGHAKLISAGRESWALLEHFAEAHRLAGWPELAPSKKDFARAKKASAGLVRQACDVQHFFELLCPVSVSKCGPVEASETPGDPEVRRLICEAAAAALGAMQKLFYPVRRLDPDTLLAWRVEGLPKVDVAVPGKGRTGKIKATKVKPAKNPETLPHGTAESSQSPPEASAPCSSVQKSDLVPPESKTTPTEAPPTAQPKKAKKAKAKPKRAQPTRLDVSGRPQAAQQRGKAKRPAAKQNTKALEPGNRGTLVDEPKKEGKTLEPTTLTSSHSASRDQFSSETRHSQPPTTASEPTALTSEAESQASFHEPRFKSSEPQTKACKAEKEPLVDFDEWLDSVELHGAYYGHLRSLTERFGRL